MAVDSANSLTERQIQRKTNANLTGWHMKDGGVQGNTMWGSQTLKPPDKRFKEPQNRPQLNTTHSFKISKFGYFESLEVTETESNVKAGKHQQVF